MQKIPPIRSADASLTAQMAEQGSTAEHSMVLDSLLFQQGRPDTTMTPLSTAVFPPQSTHQPI